MSKLFSPYNLSGTLLPNRVVMAPMTRTRALDLVPDELTALYYSQRASAGLIITEGLPISVEGRGYLYTPGLHTEEQTRAWRKVTDAVHAKGGRIFAQLWHVGRMSHVSLQPGNIPPVSSGEQPAENTNVFAWVEPNKGGPIQASNPRALTSDEVKRVTQDFVKAAQSAMEAGFDGIELMAANGFLFDQFLSSSLNTRTDEYGGSIANRMRFLLETLDALSAAIGSSKVAVRFSPFGRLYDMRPYPEETETWEGLATALNARNLAFVHLNYQPTYNTAETPLGFSDKFRQNYHGTLIAAGGFNQQIAEAELERGRFDLIAFGTSYIANPDLVERMQNGWPIAQSDPNTYYGVIGAKGYTDYPTYAPQQVTEPAEGT
jgi:N-ethylmaleimide reductase